MFQSTLPRRERRQIQAYPALLPLFQSTLPRRERRYKSDGNTPVKKGFNPRSREGSDNNPICAFPGSIGFNPRSREGSDCLYRFRLLCRYCVSIHAPAKGATGRTCDHDGKRLCFNPRSREGSDLDSFLFYYLFIRVSIHAPAKGATEME